ncbi:hypothetical protein AgCh_002101 [Apium graveolens]
MKKLYKSVFSSSVLMLLVLGCFVMKSPVMEKYQANPLYFNTTNPLDWMDTRVLHPKNDTKLILTETIVLNLFISWNISKEEQEALNTWNLLKFLISSEQALPNAVEAIKEAGTAWNNLMTSVEAEKVSRNKSSRVREKEKQCPHFLSKMNATELDRANFELRIPCGLTQGSSITIIGIPGTFLGDFRIDLKGETLPGEPHPPIILHYNVRLLGDKITKEPVIVQNTWTVAHDWGEEERCPSPSPDKNKKVDKLDQCNELVGKDVSRVLGDERHTNQSRKVSVGLEGSLARKYFPFKQGYLSVATLRVGSEGIQMTVDGKHITSFAFRETLEPWLVTDVKILGDVKLASVVASGLPTSEEVEYISDLEALKSSPHPGHKLLNLFIGVFSTANNFKRRMAVRRTWMQYAAVRSGEVAVRFFVGLHKNQMVNKELWDEARTYGDIQLMPFVDYYSLITWKTIAICIYGTQVVSAKYIMKTDDDAFVRVDEVVTSLNGLNVTRGVLYGLINSDSRPHRSHDSKWYISPEEWPAETYPPWAHGPGYVLSSDIATTIYERHKRGRLKMFRLEDVAMGIWIADMKKKGLKVTYVKEKRIFNVGCENGYVIAHYQAPRELLCLWQKLQEGNATCCGD